MMHYFNVHPSMWWNRTPSGGVLLIWEEYVADGEIIVNTLALPKGFDIWYSKENPDKSMKDLTTATNEEINLLLLTFKMDTL